MEKGGRGRRRAPAKLPKGTKRSRSNKPDLQHLEHKAEELVNLFTSLSPTQQLNGLDVFQKTVNNVLNAVTQGRVSQVKFVPIEQSDALYPETDQNPHCLTDLAKTDQHVKLTDAIKEEPESRVWSTGSTVAIVTTTSKDGATVVQLCQGSPGGGQELDGALDLTVKEEPKEELDELSSGETTDGETTEDLSVSDTASSCESAAPGPSGAKSEKRFQCQHCKYSSPKKSNLASHMITHSGSRDFKCLRCGKLFTAASSLKRHIQAHDGVKPHKCPVCSKCFVDLASLRTHSVVHTGERLFKCDQCSKQYTNSANLSRHRRVHTGEMPYVCKEPECDARFRDMSSLKLHKLKHTGEKPYLCEVCNKQFKTSSDFKRHERIHTGERNYECPECGRRFIQGWHLKQHQRMHADDRPWPCAKCGKRLRTKSSLQHHMKSHAGIKDFHCPICQKAFSTKKYLRDHQVVHTAAKPFKCATCGQDFNQLSNLKRHERIHSDVCRYKCRHCDKAFKYINSWRYHEGIHTGEMMTCDKCGLDFRSIHGIKNHHCQPEKYEENMRRNQAKQNKQKAKDKKVKGTRDGKSNNDNLEKGLLEVGAIQVKEEPVSKAHPLTKRSCVRMKGASGNGTGKAKSKAGMKLASHKKVSTKSGQRLPKLGPLKVKLTTVPGLGSKLLGGAGSKRKITNPSTGNGKRAKKGSEFQNKRKIKVNDRKSNFTKCITPSIPNGDIQGDDFNEVKYECQLSTKCIIPSIPNGDIQGNDFSEVKCEGANSQEKIFVAVKEEVKEEPSSENYDDSIPGSSEAFTCNNRKTPKYSREVGPGRAVPLEDSEESDDDIPLSDLTKATDQMTLIANPGQMISAAPPHLGALTRESAVDMTWDSENTGEADHIEAGDPTGAISAENTGDADHIEVGDPSDAISSDMLPPVRSDDSEDTFPPEDLPPSLQTFSSHRMEDDLDADSSSSSSSSEGQPDGLPRGSLDPRRVPIHSQVYCINNTDQQVPT